MQDIYARMREKTYNAIETVARLRLYITVTGYPGSLRDLILAGGFTCTDYDLLLLLYNRQLAHSFQE